MTDNVSKLMFNTKPQIQEAQKKAGVINVLPKITPSHILFKVQKIKSKEKVLKRPVGW